MADINCSVLGINTFYQFFITVTGYDNDDYFDEEEPDSTEISLGQILESHATSEDEFCNNSYEYEQKSKYLYIVYFKFNYLTSQIFYS